MNKLLITAGIMISALTTQGCAETLNEFYTGLLIANHAAEQPVHKA